MCIRDRYTPIEKAGVYVPGGTAAYPSTEIYTLSLHDALPILQTFMETLDKIMEE